MVTDTHRLPPSPPHGCARAARSSASAVESTLPSADHDTAATACAPAPASSRRSSSVSPSTRRTAPSCAPTTTTSPFPGRYATNVGTPDVCGPSAAARSSGAPQYASHSSVCFPAPAGSPAMSHRRTEPSCDAVASTCARLSSSGLGWNDQPTIVPWCPSYHRHRRPDTADHTRTRKNALSARGKCVAVSTMRAHGVYATSVMAPLSQPSVCTHSPGASTSPTRFQTCASMSSEPVTTCRPDGKKHPP